MNRSWRMVALLTAGLMMLIVSAACGRTGSDEGGETATRKAQSTTENQINSRSRDQVQDGGRLVWPMSSMPVTFNYGHIDGTDFEHVDSKRMLMPRIYLNDASGTPFWNPDYLASEPTIVTEP